VQFVLYFNEITAYVKP